MLDHLFAVIMAGGGGTRLWPLSRQHHPKQTLSFVGGAAGDAGRTLFQSSVDRLLPLLPLERILVVTASEQVAMLMAQYPQLPRENFIVEPLGRGTASCIGLAALHVRRMDPDAVMIVVTADHHINDVDTFCGGVLAASGAAQKGYLVTLGITPTYASTGYGYIRFGESLGMVEGFEVFEAAAFTEKPDKMRAQDFLDAGIYAWNSGMFVWRVDRILEEIALRMPALHQVLVELSSAWAAHTYEVRLADLWPTLAKETIDYGIMERANRVAVIPVDMGWSDIGTWASVMEIRSPDDDGNVLVGDVVQIATERSMVLARGDRLVVAIGLEDVIVVDTPDAVLIARRGMSERVRDVVERLRDEHRLEKL
jgi:mannose-1-phosphate guanylyltransferase